MLASLLCARLSWLPAFCRALRAALQALGWVGCAARHFFKRLALVTRLRSALRLTAAATASGRGTERLAAIAKRRWLRVEDECFACEAAPLAGANVSRAKNNGGEGAIRGLGAAGGGGGGL